MTTATVSRPASLGRTLGLVTIVESVLIFVPLTVLGAAIEWPASLDDPAEIALPRLLEHEGATRLGYLVYLLYSIAFLPVAISISTWRHRGPATLALWVAGGAAAASALARAIGITRWLTTAFPLAELWRESSTEGTREAVSVQFETLNTYGGAIGEILGVSVFAAVWLAATIILPGLPRWARGSGVIVLVLLTLPALELVGVDAGALVSFSSAAITCWLFAVGVAMVRDPAPADPAPADPVP